MDMTLLHYLGLPSQARAAYLLGMKQSTPERILSAVSGYTGISTAAIMAKGRHRPIVEARHIAMHLMRKSAGMTLVAIGDLFDRDHSTVINSIKVAESLIETDRSFEKMYNGIIERI